MVLIRQVLALLLTFGSVAQAVVGIGTDRKDLTDYVATEDLVYELGIDTSEADFPLAKKMSFGQDRLLIIVDKADKGLSESAQRMDVYLDGILIHQFTVSTGAETPKRKPNGKWTNRRTPIGSYRVYYRSRNHVSKAWEGASMPYAQFFHTAGIAFHATTPNHYHELGRRASGGCVRLHPTNARIMWDLVAEIGVDKTLVTVFDGSVQAYPFMAHQQNTLPQTPVYEDFSKNPQVNQAVEETIVKELPTTEEANQFERDRVKKQKSRQVSITDTY